MSMSIAGQKAWVLVGGVALPGSGAPPVVVLQGRCDAFIKVPAPGHMCADTTRPVGIPSQPLRAHGVGTILGFSPVSSGKTASDHGV